MQSRYYIPLALCGLLIGCANDQPSIGSTSLRSFTASQTPAYNAPPISGKVTRSKAIRHSLTYNPSLQALRAELRALEAEALQAGLRPNPELNLDVENFAGQGSTRGFNGSEITTAISQKFETASKRSKRTLVASLEAEALRARIRAEERETATAADNAFTGVLEAGALERVAEENLNKSRTQLDTINSMLEAGSSTRIDVNRAKIAVSEANETLDSARSAKATATAELARVLGAGSGKIDISGSLDEAPASPGSSIANHPALRAAALEYAGSEATYELEKSKRVSDVSIGGGIRESREIDETSAVVGISIPLPLFDRNQGNVAAAKERIGKAEAEGNATAGELRARLSTLTGELQSARSRVADLDTGTLTAARQALGDTETAYAAGKKSLLEYLDARESLFEIERRRISARADLLRASNSLHHLTKNQ